MEKQAENDYASIGANLFGGLETSTQSERAESFCPYKKLWAAVLKQAVLDARSKKKSRQAEINRIEAEMWLLNSDIRKRQDLYRKEIDAWLTEGNLRFIMACLFAGFDPSSARAKVKIARKANYFTTCEGGNVKVNRKNSDPGQDYKRKNNLTNA